MVTIVVLTLVMLHAPGGLSVAVNPVEVVSLRQRNLSSQNPHVRCTINLTDGRSLAVIEDCKEVFEKLNGK
jgi:hypothetical protein